MADTWSGVVLTGGRSRRMGRDKALLPIDGEPMAVRVAHALQVAGAAAVACIGGDVDALRAVGLVALDDTYPNAGPLGGILSGLTWSSQPIVVITPCDLVAPSAGVYRDLVLALTNSDAMAAVPIVDGEWRPLPVAFRREAHRSLADAFAGGERAVHRAMEGLARVTVEVGPLPDADTPEDLPEHR